MIPGPPAMETGDPPALDTVWAQFRWPSCVERKQDMIEAVEAVLLPRLDLDEGGRHWLRLCLDEALVNALVHGNEADPGAVVTAVAGTHRGHWVVRIDDQGDGFTPSAMPDFDDPASLLLEHGRGIRLMQEWLDELRYYRRGATVWMARRT